MGFCPTTSAYSTNAPATVLFHAFGSERAGKLRTPSHKGKHRERIQRAALRFHGARGKVRSLGLPAEEPSAPRGYCWGTPPSDHHRRPTEDRRGLEPTDKRAEAHDEDGVGLRLTSEGLRPKASLKTGENRRNGLREEGRCVTATPGLGRRHSRGHSPSYRGSKRC